MKYTPVVKKASKNHGIGWGC